MTNQEPTQDIIARAKKIKLLLMDCDGVMTDGCLYFTEKGESMKVFHVRDGQGLVSWHKAGFQSGIISGRNSKKILESRASELGINYVKTCSINKVEDLLEILQNAHLSYDEVAYIGDDIGDISIMEKVGLPIAVADASSKLLPYTMYKANKKGGHGAVREITDLLLSAKHII
jgi:YrbI family 3-deoxy-D-manno-octulosonate 8-phosphate phosphatase